MKKKLIVLENIWMNSYSHLHEIMSLLWVNKFNLSFTSYAVNNKVTEANALKKKKKRLSGS